MLFSAAIEFERTIACFCLLSSIASSLGKVILSFNVSSIVSLNFAGCAVERMIPDRLLLWSAWYFR